MESKRTFETASEINEKQAATVKDLERNLEVQNAKHEFWFTL